MDYQPYSNQQPPYFDKRSSGMATAAMILGIIGLSLVCCPYVSIPCGALAIIFALLSRGGERTCSTRGQTGLILGILGLSLGILFTIFALLYSFVLSNEAAQNRALYRDIYMDIYEKTYDDAYENTYRDLYENIYRDMDLYMK